MKKKKALTSGRKRIRPDGGHRRRIRLRKNWQLLMLCIPALTAYLLFNYVPMTGSIMAFKDYRYNLGIYGSEWNHFKNFEFLFRSTALWRIVRNTVGYSLLFLVTGNVVNIMVALLAYEIDNKKCLKLYQGVIQFPRFVSWVIVGFITYAILDPKYGLLNQLMAVLGKSAVDTYSTPGAWPFIPDCTKDFAGELDVLTEGGKLASGSIRRLQMGMERIMKKSILKKGQRYKIAIHIFFILFALLFILPFVLVVSVSFSSEASITAPGGGYSLIPKEFSLDAYRLAFKNPEQIRNGYMVTIFTAVVGTVSSLAVAGMIAYSLARSTFQYKKIVTFIVFFGGGTIPTYIIYTKYYHLGNSIWIYLLPGISGGAWNTLMIRTFMKGIPESLFESAEIDGAKEFTIFARIALPLSKPVFATVGFMTLVGRWNDWSTSLVYIRDERLYTLQYSLQRILNDASFLKSLVDNPLFQNSGIDVAEVMAQPTETLKYAMCVIAAGPMLFIFPFFQKYFEKGMVVGSVKG